MISPCLIYSFAVVTMDSNCSLGMLCRMEEAGAAQSSIPVTGTADGCASRSMIPLMVSTASSYRSCGSSSGLSAGATAQSREILRQGELVAFAPAAIFGTPRWQGRLTKPVVSVY